MSPKKNAYGLDVDDKRILFVVGCIAVILLVSTLTVGAATGAWAPFFAAATVIFGIVGILTALIVLWRLAKKVFPR